jgi:hypothetical protein
MTPSDADCAELCAAIYETISGTGFDHFDVGADDGICWAIKRLPGFDTVVLRGSQTGLDWIRDFQALDASTRIGTVHQGFYEGMEHMWADLKPMLEQPVIVTGHSLGAARAGILTALMIADGMRPLARIVFGEPKPGFVDLAKLINSVPGRSYRNGDDRHHDLVTDVPFSFPPFQYVHPTPIIPVCVRPTGGLFERLGVFAYHHIQLYDAALKAKAEAA